MKNLKGLKKFKKLNDEKFEKIKIEKIRVYKCEIC